MINIIATTSIKSIHAAPLVRRFVFPPLKRPVGIKTKNIWAPWLQTKKNENITVNTYRASQSTHSRIRPRTRTRTLRTSVLRVSWLCCNWLKPGSVERLATPWLPPPRTLHSTPVECARPAQLKDAPIIYSKVPAAQQRSHARAYTRARHAPRSTLHISPYTVNIDSLQHSSSHMYSSNKIVKVCQCYAISSSLCFTLLVVKCN